MIPDDTPTPPALPDDIKALLADTPKVTPEMRARLEQAAKDAATPTPRTDAKEQVTMGDHLLSQGIVMADFARQLERELAEARAESAMVCDNLHAAIGKLRADLANCERDVHELLRLLGEIRMATGDRGKRNQAELVAYCADLAKRAAVLEKVRAYPYIPSGVIAIIERELRTNTTTP